MTPLKTGETSPRPFTHRWRESDTSGPETQWRLYWRRSDLKWHAHEPGAYGSLQDSLTVVDEDTHCCFFG